MVEDSAAEGELCARCRDQVTLAPDDHTLINDWTPPPAAPATTVHTGPVFETIGDYEVLDKLGQGGMGAVYRARQISLGRMVALKVLPVQFESDPEFLGRFQREAKMAASLQHANLVRVFSAGEAAGSHYIAMELIEGENLHQRLRRGRITMPEALRICADVARGLQFGWERAQLVHRDIKPSNIYLSHGGEVKVGDLGLAKSLTSNTTGLTQSGTMMGTPYYMSPEQIRGDKALDFRADIYSLGCTLYEMLVGQPPYPGHDPISIAHQHINSPVPAILKVLPGCPIQLVRLLGRMLKKQPRERHASYSDLIAEMDWVREQIESGAVASPGTTPAVAWKAPAVAAAPTPVRAPSSVAPTLPPARKRNLQVPIALGAGVLAIAATALFVTAGKSKHTAAKPPPASAPRAAAAEQTIKLLDLVEVPRDVIRGDWSRKPDGLSLDQASGWAICEIPYEPPAEYDLTTEFTVKSGGFNVDLHLRGGDSAFMWKLNAYGTTPPIYGLDLLDGRRMRGRPEASREDSLALEIGQRYETRVEVRRTGLRAFVNGREFISWNGDYHRLSTEDGARLRNERRLGLSTYGRSVVFHRADLRVIGSGSASPSVQSAPAASNVSNPAAAATSASGTTAFRVPPGPPGKVRSLPIGGVADCCLVQNDRRVLIVERRDRGGQQEGARLVDLETGQTVWQVPLQHMETVRAVPGKEEAFFLGREGPGVSLQRVDLTSGRQIAFWSGAIENPRLVQLAVSPDGGRICAIAQANLETSGTIHPFKAWVVDASTLASLAEWRAEQLETVANPTWLDNDRVLISARGGARLQVFDVRSPGGARQSLAIDLNEWVEADPSAGLLAGSSRSPSLTLASMTNAFAPITLRPWMASRRIVFGGGVVSAVDMNGQRLVSYDVKTHALLSEFSLAEYADVLQVSHDGSFALTRDRLAKDTAEEKTQLTLWRLRSL